MPGGFTDIGDVCNALDAGSNATTSLGTAVTASASTNTKGAYSQLIASTANDCCLLEICLYFDANSFGAGPQSAAVDIAIGASGSEVVLVPNVIVNAGYLNDGGIHVMVPVQMPAGTRIAARCQATGASAVINVKVNTIDGGFPQQEGFSGADAIGFQSGATLGTAVTPSGTANTLGSYAQLVSSTTRDYIGFFAVFDNQQNNASQTTLLDIAIGAAASEVVILPSIPLALNPSAGGQHNVSPLSIPFIPLRIPSGTRIAARCQCSVAAGNNIGLTLYGVF